MKIIKIISISVVTIAVVLFAAGCYLTRPNKNMDVYKKYYNDDTAAPDSGRVKVTYLGVSSLLLDDGQTQLLVDAFFSRSSMMRTALSKISTDSSLVNSILSQYKIDRLKAIFISHSHYDHSFDAPYVAKKTKAILLGSQSTLNIGKGGGLTDSQMTLFEPGRDYQFGDFTITVIASKHSPATAVNDDLGKIISEPLAQPAKATKYLEGSSFDFLIKHKDHTIYIKPSANFIAGKLKNMHADALFLGTGTMGKRDSTFMNDFYRETVEMLRPKVVIPVHWDNFLKPFSDHLEMMPRLMDKTDKGFDFMIGRTQRDTVDFKILQGGKSIVLFQKKN